MGRKRSFAGAAAGVWLLACSALPGAAAVVIEEHFDRAGAVAGKGSLVATEHGKGWKAGIPEDSTEGGVYLRFPAASLNPVAGSIEMEIVRGEVAEWESIFTLVAEDGQSLVRAIFAWEGNSRFRRPFISFTNHRSVPPLWHSTQSYKGQTIRLSGVPVTGIGKNDRFHLVFTWGPSRSDCAIYLDGRKLPAGLDDEFGMTEAIRKAKWLAVGAEPFGETGASSHMNSTIEYVRIHDVAVSGPELFTADRYDVKLEQAPEVSAVTHAAARVAGFSGKLIAGNQLTVTLEGTPGAVGTFDVVHFPDLSRTIPLDWRGWGVYLEDKRFHEPDEVDLRDVEGYRVYAGPRPFNVAAPGLEPVAELDVKEQTYLLEDLEIDTPYYVAVVAEMRDGTLRPVIEPTLRQPLAETAPGVYSGLWDVGYQHRYPRAAVVGRLRLGERVATQVGDDPFAVDPALTIAVKAEPEVLKADEKSTSKVTVTVTDANGNAVPGHEIRFLLATTSQYTGVVGGGAFTDQVGGAIKTDLRGETDLFGRLTATYVAGFAAKTAVIVARDMTANSTGAGYVTTFIQATAQLELEPPVETEAMAAGYEIAVSSSDAWLTADGKSQARITARVTLAGKPVEGHQVAFQIAGGTGTLRTVRGVTETDGTARAVYTAGTKIGVVLITATDTAVDITGSVQIELRSDAPAKIAITTDPAKLPADGRSRAELTVLVTDINDNPNDNVRVEYAITEGGGSLEEKGGVTDRRGETTNTYTAGRSPGRVSIEITVRSPVPTEEEFAKARDLAVSVPDYRFR